MQHHLSSWSAINLPMKGTISPKDGCFTIFKWARTVNSTAPFIWNRTKRFPLKDKWLLLRWSITNHSRSSCLYFKQPRFLCLSTGHTILYLMSKPWRKSIADERTNPSRFKKRQQWKVFGPLCYSSSFMSLIRCVWIFTKVWSRPSLSSGDLLCPLGED